MKTLFLSFCILSLTGCASVCTEQANLVDQNYVVRKAPSELYTIPEYPTIDLISATQADVAEWITNLEERSRELELKIQKLKEFFEAPIVEVK